MRKPSKQQQEVLKSFNYDLFRPEILAAPAPATLYTKIREQEIRQALVTDEEFRSDPGELPDEKELARRYEMYNRVYFDGRLPRVKILYSNRMTSAGSYTPQKKLIKIGRRYHQIFPEEINDTLKHEMIHIRHMKHDRAFKDEAIRIGASVRANSHPALTRPPKYIYLCANCGREYPRQKRLRMASCGICSRGGVFDERFKLRLLRKKS
ncbi:MAG: SprT-like domain-containing protein [Candidatus Zixiibacteriota bacterium]